MSESAADLRRESDDQLSERLTLLRREMFHLRVRRALGGAYPDPSRLAKLRRAVARILTIQSMRARGVAPASGEERNAEA